MTENHQTCIRGCTMRCFDDQCLTTGRHDHLPRPRRATVGLLCQDCSSKILDALTDIELYAPWLHLGLEQTGDREGHRGKVSGSPALINLHAAVLLDTTDPTDLALDEDTGSRSILGTLNYWLRLLCRATQQAIPAPAETMTQGLGALRGLHGQLCAQTWADRYHQDITALAAEIRRSARAPKPIARCYGRLANRNDCGRYLFPPDGAEEIVCDRCGRRYTGEELIKLQIQGEIDGVA